MTHSQPFQLRLCILQYPEADIHLCRLFFPRTFSTIFAMLLSSCNFFKFAAALLSSSWSSTLTQPNPCKRRHFWRQLHVNKFLFPQKTTNNQTKFAASFQKKEKMLFLCKQVLIDSRHTRTGHHPPLMWGNYHFESVIGESSELLSKLREMWAEV